MDLDQITFRLMGLSARIRFTRDPQDKAALEAEFDGLLTRLDSGQRAGVAWISGGAQSRAS